MKKRAANGVTVHVIDLNTRKAKAFSPASFASFSDLTDAVTAFTQGHDYDLDVDCPVSTVGKDLETYYGVAKLLADHHQPVAIALVENYDHTWFQKAAVDDYRALEDQVGSVRHAKDKEDFVLAYFEDTGMEVPKWLQGYIDTDKFFQDHFDINLDGAWTEDATGVYVYENTR